MTRAHVAALFAILAQLLLQRGLAIRDSSTEHTEVFLTDLDSKTLNEQDAAQGDFDSKSGELSAEVRLSEAPSAPTAEAQQRTQAGTLPRATQAGTLPRATQAGTQQRAQAPQVFPGYEEEFLRKAEARSRAIEQDETIYGALLQATTLIQAAYADDLFLHNVELYMRQHEAELSEVQNLPQQDKDALKELCDAQYNVQRIQIQENSSIPDKKAAQRALDDGHTKLIKLVMFGPTTVHDIPAEGNGRPLPPRQQSTGAQRQQAASQRTQAAGQPPRTQPQALPDVPTMQLGDQWRSSQGQKPPTKK